MKISNKISVQQIVEQCQLHGLSDIVISPGSRNAPFTLSFTHNPFFTCYSIVDERSAGYFALGISQQKRKPAVLVCTSGTAALNYASAVAEAHMQGIPLLIITADRQSSGLQIGDGQVINQVGIFSNYCDHSFNIIEDENDQNRVNEEHINKAFELVNSVKGPIHLNVQLAEPLYITTEKSQLKKVKSSNQNKTLVGAGEKVRKEELASKWNTYSKKLILLSEHSFENLGWLELVINKDENIVVLSETTSNFHHPAINSCIDRTIELINKDNPEGFIPDLIITVGQSVISKKIKHLFRAHKPKAHWSFSEVRNENLFELETIESFQHLDELSVIAEQELASSDSLFKSNWDKIKAKTEKSHETFLDQVSFSDLQVFGFLNKQLPSCNLQMGNSSVVRYFQLFNQRNNLTYNSNRGVSGIEGCTSTALGAHLVTDNSILVSGDISFFYDSNAFWNGLVPTNFKVIVINNGEGNIFKILPHPKKFEKSLRYFTTPHQTSVAKFCDLYGLKHYKATSLESLETQFPTFITKNEQPSVLEIDTSEAENDEILRDYFSFLKENNDTTNTQKL